MKSEKETGSTTQTTQTLSKKQADLKVDEAISVGGQDRVLVRPPQEGDFKFPFVFEGGAASFFLPVSFDLTRLGRLQGGAVEVASVLLRQECGSGPRTVTMQFLQGHLLLLQRASEAGLDGTTNLSPRLLPARGHYSRRRLFGSCAIHEQV